MRAKKELKRAKDHSLRVEQEKRGLEGEIQRLNNELRVRDNQLGNLERSRSEFEQRTKNLESEMKNSSRKSESGGRVPELEKMLRERSDEVKTLKGSLDKIKTEWTDLEKEFKGFQDRNKVLEQNLKTKEGQLATALEEKKRAEMAARELESVQKVVKTQVVQQAAPPVSSSVPSTEQQEALKIEMSTVRKELLELRASNEKLFKELGGANLKKDELERVLMDLKKQQTASATSDGKLDGAMKDLEKKLAAAESQLSSSKQTVGNLETKVKEAETKMETERKERKGVEVVLEGLRKELEKAKSSSPKDKVDSKEVEKLKKEVESLKLQLDTSSANATNKEQEVRNLQAEYKNRCRKVDELSESAGRLERRLKETEAQLVRTSSPNSANTGISQQQARLGSSHPGSSSDKAELDSQRKKNNELREANYKLVENVKKAEETAEKSLKDMTKKYETDMKEQEKTTRKLLSQAFPQAKVDKEPEDSTLVKENDTLKSEIVGFQNTISKLQSEGGKKGKSHSEVTTNGDPSTDSENRKLKAEISRLTESLQKVDVMLAGLESRGGGGVEEWRERCRQLELALIQTKSGGSSSTGRSISQDEGALYEDIQQVRNQLADLQNKLQTEEKERSSLQEQIRILMIELEKERGTGRDLSAQAVKLRGMLKTGQDALKQEQDLVHQLQLQLKSYQNGTGAPSLHDEIQTLKHRLAEREDQLEREISINKQLGTKLTSLGVTL